MNEHITAPVKVILVVFALGLFLFAAFAWPPNVEPYRTKLIAGGLACWVASTFFG